VHKNDFFPNKFGAFCLRRALPLYFPHMTTAKKHHVVVSGIQPSGSLHVGNYVGAVQNWLKLQDDARYKCHFFIADYHSITGDYDPDEKREQVLNLAMDLLALGIDPKRSVFFVQSHVPEHTELAWIFNTVTPVSFLERMTQFKDKSANQNKNINMGLFDYPVLQAADILMYMGEMVPVGVDQVQHVELTRDIARFFNNKFGDVFPETKPLLTDMPKLRSLTDPLKKMSKSLGEKSYIALTDEPEEIYDKLKRAVTETTGIMTMTEEELANAMRANDETQGGDETLRGVAGVWNLFALLKAFGYAEEADRILAAQPMKYGELKKLVAQRVAEYFTFFRAERKKIARDPEKVRHILAAGAEEARATAQRTMADVRKIIGIR
jgi:tryptophanyl-tRNA synthetase